MHLTSDQLLTIMKNEREQTLTKTVQEEKVKVWINY